MSWYLNAFNVPLRGVSKRLNSARNGEDADKVAIPLFSRYLSNIFMQGIIVS
jgi:hypothetical protein